MTDRWYPDRDRFFVPGPELDREIFQGDVFRGVPTLFAGHPAAAAADFAAEEPPDPRLAERPFTADEVRRSVRVHGRYAMLLPHPCDFSEGEKGTTHTVRLVAEVRPIAESRFARKDIERGRVAHLVWVPDWSGGSPERDYYCDLRTMSSVDRVWLNPERRVAALTAPAWFALVRRICFWFSRQAIDIQAFAREQAHNHPEHARAEAAVDADEDRPGKAGER